MAVVPGAVWLAINALPLFPVSVHGREARTGGWHDSDAGPVFLMPVWRRPLDTAAVEVALDHPFLDTLQSKESVSVAKNLGSLGITAAYGARVVERRVAGQTERYTDLATLVTRSST